MSKDRTQVDEALGLIRQHRKFMSGVATWSKPLGLSADGCLILLLLQESAGQSNTELAAALALNLATATKIIDRLVSDNLVHRKPDPGDRRRIQIYLTEDGAVAARKAAKRFGEFMSAETDS